MTDLNLENIRRVRDVNSGGLGPALDAAFQSLISEPGNDTGAKSWDDVPKDARGALYRAIRAAVLADRAVREVPATGAGADQ